jgi:hypothetical protein
MFSIFLFIVFLSIYTWLYYKPKGASNQHHPDGSADIATPTPSQTTPGSPNAEASLPAAELQPNQDEATVQIVDKRTPVPGQSLLVIAEEKPTVKTQSAVIEDTSSKSEPVNAVQELLPKIHPEAGEETSTAELELDADVELEPALTEEEAIALAVKTALAQDTMVDVSTGEIEDSVPELMRPKPPDPELVEAAVRDAEEKLEDFSPPEIFDGASQDPL